jgi:hypothetical protein
LLLRWVSLLLLFFAFLIFPSCSFQPQETLYFLSFSRLENQGEIFKETEGKRERVLEKPGLVDFFIKDASFYFLTRTPFKSELYSLKDGREELIKESFQTMLFLKPSFPEAPLAIREIGKERETLNLISSRGIEKSLLLPKGALPLSISPKNQLALRIWENSGKARVAKIYLMDLNEPSPSIVRPLLSDGPSEEFLSWSPMGGEFLFQRKSPSGGYSLYIYNVHNRREEIFRENAFSFQGALSGGESWSASGHLIFSQSPKREVFSPIILFKEGTEWEVDVIGASPYLSPDGEVLAFATPSNRIRPGGGTTPQADLGLFFLKEKRTITLPIDGDFLSPISASWSNSSWNFAFVAYVWNKEERGSGFKLYLYQRKSSSLKEIFYSPGKEVLTLAWTSGAPR